MEIYQLKHDVKVICVEAASFPGGIKGAFEQLNKVVPGAKDRDIFGVSKPHNGVIRYRAAAAEGFDGEGTKLGYPTFTIQKGTYLGDTLMHWQSNEMMIMGIFDKLIADKRLDGSAHCIEWYKSDTELICMVLMKPDNSTAIIKTLPL